jgi:hypothetical protein
LITKTKRIAERSDTNCDTHTQSHTDRQSTLDKYMIDNPFFLCIFRTPCGQYFFHISTRADSEGKDIG